jgi:hypothetical protein
VYKDKIDQTRRKNKERITQRQKVNLSMGLAKLKGIDPAAIERQNRLTAMRPKGFPHPKKGQGQKKGLPRSRRAEKIKPKPKAKRVRPEDNPNFIFCFRC